MHRSITIAFSLALLFSTFQARAELNELQALTRGMAQENIQTLLDARLQEAQGKKLSAGRWDNPEIEYSRESLDLPSGQSEETTLFLRQRLNIAGVKGLERDAAQRSFIAAQARTDLERRQWRTIIRQHFYTTLAAQKRASVLARYHSRLQQISSMIERRVAKGDASRYDSLRIAQELARLRSDNAQAQAESKATTDQLFSLLAASSEPLNGELIPPPSSTVQSVSIEQHPRLQALAAERDSAELLARSANREAWPEVTLGVGRKEVDEPTLQAEGNIISLGIELPLFDRRTGKARQANARAYQQQADYSLVIRQVRSELRGLQARLQARRQAALEFQSVAQSDKGSLTTIAEASYQAGEITVMQLLDAYSTELNTWQSYIDRALAARMTYIQLQQMEGS